ncbi:MAG: carboxymuconolactone decarboxylase family protein [Eubacterium sp.]|nr:carboxymuconolactone decarboxylase family protein [Eubacterium sp.]
MIYNTEARLPYVKPEEMNEKQKEFYDIHIKAFQDMPYVWLTENKELNGPSNLFTHEVDLGFEFIPLNRDIIKASIQRNGGAAHEIAILVTVSGAKAQYGMYAHTMLAQRFGVTDEQIAQIMAGIKPAGLGEKESAAYDLAVALNGVGAIAGSVYDRSVAVLGQGGFNALVMAVGMFKMVGTVLNAFNEPVPEYR